VRAAAQDGKTANVGAIEFGKIKAARSKCKGHGASEIATALKIGHLGLQGARRAIANEMPARGRVEDTIIL
jgi:hypothetical protein